MCAIWLCAGRFGLGWAHGEISFTCHMFMHFPCIRTSFQYIWYIWKCLGLFWLSFFSPSLLFTLVVSMAPKRKSTPAWNPLRSRASSSSDPTLSHIRFRDDDAFKAFSEMGVTVWRPGHLSSRADSGVLLQHVRDWSISTSFLHSRSRYAHSYHTKVGCGCASGP